jgi:hypothetical protein
MLHSTAKHVNGLCHGPSQNVAALVGQPIRRFKIPDMVEMAPQVFAQALIHERQKVDLGLQSQPLVLRIVYLLVFYCQCFRQDRVAPLDLFDLRSAVFSELCKLQL